LRTLAGRRLRRLLFVPTAGLLLVCGVFAGLEIQALAAQAGEPDIARLRAILEVALVGVGIVAIATYLVIDRSISKDIDGRLDALNQNTRRLGTAEAVGPPDPGDDEIAELDARYRTTYELLADRERAAARYRFLAEQIPSNEYYFDELDNVEAIERASQDHGFQHGELRKANRREADRRLRAALIKANEASRVKSEFIATMSHEIRTPMNAVLGLTELLLHTSLDGEQRDLASTVRTSGQALLRVIDDILDFSKMEAGKIAVEIQPFDLAKCVEEIAHLLAPQAQRKGLDFNAFVTPELPPLVLGDELRIRQVLINLVGNALKFTSTGSVSIDTSVVSRSEKTVGVRIEVSDSGIGIERKTAAGLFTAFTQADGSITRRFGGTGLGLAISKQLVELLGGTIGVESEPNVGSTFWVQLPFEIAEDASPAPLSPHGEHVLVADSSSVGRSVTTVNGAAIAGAHAAPSLPELSDDPPPALELADSPWQAPDAESETPAEIREQPPETLGRALLVEDNPVNQLVGRKQLEKIGYAVACAESGESAIEMLLRERYDVVFMDLHMPDMDGLTATKTIRQNELASGGHVPIVALTADAQPKDRLECLASGMDDYLSKPVALPELRAVLARWVHSPPAA